MAYTNGDSADYIAYRRTKIPGQEAVFHYSKDKDGEPRKHKNFSDAQLQLNKTFSDMIIAHYEHELRKEKQQEYDKEMGLPAPTKFADKDLSL